MGISRFILLAATTAAAAGCRGGSPTAGTFSAETAAQQLVPGKQEVELTVHYRLPSNPTAPTTVSYTVQLTAPQGWAVDPGSWEHSQAMKTTDIGFNETRKVSITVPADAAQSEHLVRLTISPASGPPQALDLRFQVVGKGN
jgi:hypothetical protein